MAPRSDAASLTPFSRAGDGKVSHPADQAALRAALEDASGLLWVDLFIRSEADVAVLRDVFQFHPLTIEDCLSPHVDPAKIDDHGEYLFVVVQALDAYPQEAEIGSVEGNFYLGPNYVVSSRREPVSGIDQYRERCLQDEYILSHRADWLMHGLLDALVDEYLPVVDAIDDTIGAPGE